MDIQFRADGMPLDKTMRVALAQREDAPQDVLRILALEEKLLVAGNPSAFPEALDELTRGQRTCVRWEVASNPSTPAAALEKLARNKYYCIRRAVAQNPSCPSSLLSYLALDSFGVVRSAVAARKDCPPRALARLVHDPVTRVKRTAEDNPSCPLEAIAEVPYARKLIPFESSAPTSELYRPPSSPLVLDAGGSLVGCLERLSELHDRGVLNEEEFAAAKRKLLADVENL